MVSYISPYCCFICSKMAKSSSTVSARSMAMRSCLKSGNPLKMGGGSQVTAYVEYASAFVEAGNALVYLVAQDVHALIKGERG